MCKTCRRCGSNPPEKCSQEWLTWATVSFTMRRAAHPAGCARCGAGAGCSAIEYPSLEQVEEEPAERGGSDAEDEVKEDEGAEEEVQPRYYLT